MSRLRAFPWLALPFVAWATLSMAFSQARWEHVAVLIGVPLLALWNAASKKLFLGLLPIGLLGLLYDGMHWVKQVGVTTERVHLCDLRATDLRISNAIYGKGNETIHDWIQTHPSTYLDLFFAVPYGIFIFVTLGFAVFLYTKNYERMRLFGWAFLTVNLAGFVTYHLYPAAAPWYFHAYGCAVDLSAHASEGPNLARVDSLLGVPYFHSFYGRSNDVFGAVPSLHVSYPLLILLFGWPVLHGPGRAAAAVFLVSMCMAAVYLDHHWIIDVFLGLVYTVVVYAALMTVSAIRASRAARLPNLHGEVAR